jgi:hypothetical protein
LRKLPPGCAPQVTIAKQWNKKRLPLSTTFPTHVLLRLVGYGAGQVFLTIRPRSAMGLGAVKRRRRGKLVEQMRATAVFERGRFRVILRKHFSWFWSLGSFQNGRAVRQNERNQLLDRPAMAPFCGALTQQRARLVAAPGCDPTLVGDGGGETDCGRPLVANPLWQSSRLC